MLKRFVEILVLLIITIAISVSSCKKHKDTDLSEFTKKTDNTENTDNVKPVINEDQINEIIGSFSSPVEMAATINSLNVPFSKKYLVDPDYTENYDTNDKKAFALGVLSADLGYINVYERSSLVVEYLSAIKRLTDDLRISQFFDFQSMKRLATSNDNIDSLQFLSVQSFRDMDEHLRSSGRSSLSLLMISGVWLESLYLLTQVEVATKNKNLLDKIGEQKVLFNLLYPLLKIYSTDPYFKTLTDNFKELKSVFDKIEITYKQGEPEVQIIDGRPVVTQNDESVVNITSEQVQQIILITEKIRNKLIKL